MKEKRKKIAIIGAKEFPSKCGADAAIEANTKRLKNDYDFTVYCNKVSALEGEVIDGIKVIEVSLLSGKHLRMFFCYLYAGLHCLFKNYDFIHIHHIDGAFIIPFLRLKYKVILTSHGRPYLVEKWSRIVKLYFRLMEFISIHFSSVMISVSLPLRYYYQAKYKKEVFYIPNGIEEERINTGGAKEILDHIGFSGEYMFFTSARIMPTKGVDLLVKAVKKINKKIPTLVVGRLYEVPNYYRYLRQNSSSNIYFYDVVNSRSILMGLMKLSKIFIFPSYEEAMSMVLLEVASNGVPIICSNILANKYFLEEGVIYFESDDFIDLAEKIDYALENYPKVR